MKKSQHGNILGGLIGFAFGMALFVAWCTHIYVCFNNNRWGFLIAGAFFFPIAIVHGMGIWFGWWPS